MGFKFFSTLQDVPMRVKQYLRRFANSEIYQKMLKEILITSMISTKNCHICLVSVEQSSSDLEKYKEIIRKKPRRHPNRDDSRSLKKFIRELSPDGQGNILASESNTDPVNIFYVRRLYFCVRPEYKTIQYYYKASNKFYR